MKKNEIILICRPLIFYSDFDEAAFFEWINKIKCVKSYKGIGEELHIYLKSKRISLKNLFELEGILKRYFFNVNQLNIFKEYEEDENYTKVRKLRNELIKNNYPTNFLHDPTID